MLLQDFTGVPCVVDLAAMRDALRDMGADPKRANPLMPADLVIDHSVQVDEFGTPDSFAFNALLEFQRNRERYMLLRWGQKAFQNFRVVPPDTGIVHQVNLEYLAPVVFTDRKQSPVLAYPDTLVGTDSHTTMINGLGVVGWGVGGIEAEACMLGQPISMLLPEVVGFKLNGRLARRLHRDRSGAHRHADAAQEGRGGQVRRVLWTRLERAEPGRSRDHRQHGAGIWRDHRLLPGRSADARLSAAHQSLPGTDRAGGSYAKEQGLFRTADSTDPDYSDTLELDLATVVPSMAGPKRPQDRINLPDVKKNFLDTFNAARKPAEVATNGSTSTAILMECRMARW